MPLTGFPNSNHKAAVDQHSDTVLLGLQSRDKDNPVTARRITESVGVPGPVVRAIVHHLREIGHPIGSNSKGYWYAHSYDELGPTIMHLEQRIRSMRSVAGALRKSFGGRHVTK